jgi:hypothetical protein
MTREPNLLDDPVIRRVAAVRPEFPAADLDPQRPAARELLVRVTSAAVESEPSPSTRARQRRRVAVLAVAAVGVVAVGLVLTASLQGPAGTGTQPAAAAIVRHVEHELATAPGTILVERVYSTFQEPDKPISRSSDYSVTEAVPNSTVVNSLGDFRPFGGASASIDGDDEVYLPQTNTIYISNPYTPYIHPGPRPGTFIYRAGPGSPTPAASTFTRSFILTAKEVQSLESGRTELLPHQVADGHFKLEIYTLPREPATEAGEIRDELRRHQLHFDGRVTLDGHGVYRFVEYHDRQQFQTRLFVDAGTYAPVKIVIRNRVVGGTVLNIGIWREYRVLPITVQNQKLLSLRALHPNARIDRNRTDFLQAQRKAARG